MPATDQFRDQGPANCEIANHKPGGGESGPLSLSRLLVGVVETAQPQRRLQTKFQPLTDTIAIALAQSAGTPTLRCNSPRRTRVRTMPERQIRWNRMSRRCQGATEFWGRFPKVQQSFHRKLLSRAVSAATTFEDSRGQPT